jgi:hypothetical protein
LVFTFVSRCQGGGGSQNEIGMPDSIVNRAC